ncbi:MAG: SirA family protein [Gammaproteobacteria bacterium]|nr:SirA family protein [Gammaproteobacteria bacterium]
MSSEVEELDARGLLCPLPVIRTQDRVRSLADGVELIITATDPGVMQDIPAWCRVHGHVLLSAEHTGCLCVVRLRVIREKNAP